MCRWSRRWIGVLVWAWTVPVVSATLYQDLVARGKYREAVRVVCKHYRLACHKASFKVVADDPDGNFAVTDLDGTISLSTGAFRHDSEPLPHAGWLGALIGHELVHVDQGTFRRIYSRTEQIYAGNHYYVAAQELEGWGYMMDHARDFGLTYPMVRDIEMHREVFEWIVNHNGRPMNSTLPANVAKNARLKAMVKSWGISPED